MAKDKKFRKKKKLGSYPFVSVVFSVTLALFVMGLFGLLLMMTKNLTTIIQENVEMQVFLNKNLSQNEITKITKTLSSKDYVIKKEGVAQIAHITKEEAAKEFYEETGEDFVAFLGDNPLRDVVVIKINPDFHEAQNLVEIKKEIGFIRGVHEVTYIESLVNSIRQNVRKVSLVLLGFSVILLVVVIILINNTIKLALFSQRFLIRSMQLVGATTHFIRKPFLMRASLFGFLSALIAIGLLASLMKYLNTEVEGLLELLHVNQLLILGGGIALVGIFVGFMSTFAAIRRYMKMSLDELY
ncbi:permease-like cell division protein FtsX [Reichenbachiella carrageenanivorans]|uniref:Cell division protein FtsX n=1 Tax=Reichenbachiella carrageenanivorans TaxID=2979869 RepID=A0ABY6D1Q3_9BACT|nr:permease-like cell division protein FtsX [Reichenbachiella carrageenanivorans]UXX80095.1 permease-like cell division protein FtsX [Reichenbachiella carrageenanivorans]